MVESRIVYLTSPFWYKICEEWKIIKAFLTSSYRNYARAYLGVDYGTFHSMWVLNTICVLIAYCKMAISVITLCPG